MIANIILSILCVLCFTVTNVNGQDWEKISPESGNAPGERRQAVMAFSESDNALYLFAGRDSNGDLKNDLWKYDVGNNTWTELSPTNEAPPKRFSFSGGMDQNTGSLVIFGGEGEDGNILNDAWSYSTVNNEWTQLVENGKEGSPAPRYGQAGGVVNIGTGNEGYMLVSHGFDKKDRFSDSFALRLSDSEWIDITPEENLPTGRCLVSGATMVNPTDANLVELGMFGGCGSGGYGPCPSSEMWILTVEGLDSNSPVATWQMTEECLRARNYAAMATDPTYNDGTFFVFGGVGGPLAGTDQDGQLNTLDLENRLWAQSVLGGDAPAIPSGTAQSTLATSTDQTLWLQLGATNELYKLSYASAEFEDNEECRNSIIPTFLTLHGVFMGLSWGFLIPIGVFIARFGRIKDPLWFKLHRGIQVTGVILGLVGFIFAMLMVSGGKFLAVPHSLIGLVVTFFGLQQPLNAYFRPHKTKGEPIESKRWWWEAWHLNTGRLALVLGLVNPFWGIYYLSGISGGFIAYAIWVAVYLFAYIFLTAKGLPYVANGPSSFAQWLNATICCCLSPWDDSFKTRGTTPATESSSSLRRETADEAGK